ncbi:MAG: hypothetical protein AAB352_02345 [Patescibacteria group bacterium]
MQKITDKATLKNILEKKGACEILAKHNLPCMSCPMAYFELEKLEIGEVSKMYGLPLEKILKDLNNLK